jgi:hypothetical protein|nr:MAG TPA: hypothetical protein [Caudoviricetes sp.]
MRTRTLCLHIPVDLHREMKIKVAKEGITVKDYILHLIKKDLSKAK